MRDPCQEGNQGGFSDATVAIIGSGNIGSTLAANFAAGSQDFLLAGRDQEAVGKLATDLGGHAEVVSVDEAIERAGRDLPMRLHGIRLAGEFAEIRAADLRFTESETQALLHSVGITLSAAGIALLHQRTEGWAAGLRLAAITLAGHPDPELALVRAGIALLQGRLDEAAA